MANIIFPLKSGNKGLAVSDLHQTLTASGYKLADGEQSSRRFGASTRKALIEFQNKHGLETTGVVDQMTASLLNHSPIKQKTRSARNGYEVAGVIHPTEGARDVELPGLSAQDLLRPAASEGRPASLGDLFSTIPENGQLSDTLQLSVANVLSRTGVDYRQLTKQLKAAGLDPKQSIYVERTLRLGDLTLTHLPLIRHLQEIVEQDSDASLKSLAHLEHSEWFDKVYTYGVPPWSSMSPVEYARHLKRNCRPPFNRH